MVTEGPGLKRQESMVLQIADPDFEAKVFDSATA